MENADDLFKPVAAGSPAHRAIVKARQEGARLKARLRRLEARERALLRDDPATYRRQRFVLETEIAAFAERWSAVAGAAGGMARAVTAKVAATHPDATERAAAARAMAILDAALAAPATEVRT